MHAQFVLAQWNIVQLALLHPIAQYVKLVIQKLRNFKFKF